MRTIEPRGNVIAHAGRFPATITPEIERIEFAFVHLDADLFEPTMAGLEFFYPRVPAGGVIVIHDYNAWPGARRAVDEFCAGKRVFPIPMPDKSGSAVIAKTA
jgi:O-methyltransferase